MALILSALLMLSASVAKAETELTYDCEVIIATSEIGLNEGEFKFKAAASSGSHGGETRSFKQGAHEVVIMADAQWLGLSWFRDNRKVAEGLFVLGPMDRTMARVGILYDPNDSGDQVSVGCTESLVGGP